MMIIIIIITIYLSVCQLWCPGIAQSVQRLATGWTVQESNTDVGEIFRIRPDRPWGTTSHLYYGHRIILSDVKLPEGGVGHPPPSSTEVEERKSYTLLPFYAFMASSRAKFIFTLLCQQRYNYKPLLRKLRLKREFNPLNAELNPICHLLALLGAHHILHVSRVRVKSHLPFAGIIRSSPYSPR